MCCTMQLLEERLPFALNFIGILNSIYTTLTWITAWVSKAFNQ